MAEIQNFVRIEGYLKDTTLALGRSKETQQENISGAITVMVDEFEEYRIWYYANRYRKLRDGETELQENGFYKDLVRLLPDKTTSWSKCKLADGSLEPFESCKKSLTKVVCTAKFEERFFKDRQGAVRSQADVRGTSAYEVTREFSPHTYFEVNGCVNAVREETDSNGDTTGRVILDMSIPHYDGRMCKMAFVSANADVAGVLLGFNVNDTYTIRGRLCRLHRTKKTAVVSEGSFGEAPREVTVTEFVDERVITGGNSVPLAGDKAIALEDVKKGLVLRNEEMERVEAADVNSSAKPSAPASAPKAEAGSFGSSAKPAAPKKETAAAASKYADIDF